MRLDSYFCIETSTEALAKHPNPDIFNTDQGGQFTSRTFTKVLKNQGIQISMDGKGRWIDNRFVERFWRSYKYEYLYLTTVDAIKDLQKGRLTGLIFIITKDPMQLLMDKHLIRFILNHHQKR